jgi:hypothetical protein
MRASVILFALAYATPAAAAPEGDWLASLTDRVIDDVRAGKPLVVQVHVPLCDNSVTACGNAKLGDGETIGGSVATSGGYYLTYWGAHQMNPETHAIDRSIAERAAQQYNQRLGSAEVGGGLSVNRDF